MRDIWSCPINVVSFSAEDSSIKTSENGAEVAFQQSSLNYKNVTDMLKQKKIGG